MNRYFLAHVGLLLWGLSSTVLGRAFTVVEPGAFDAQLFAYIGQKWLQGFVPYIDIWDNKPPGIFLVMATGLSITPRNFLGVAIVEGAFVVGCIGTVFAIMRRFGASEIPVFLATASCAVVANLSYYNQGGALTEVFVLWPAAMSILMFSKGLPNFSSKFLMLSGCFAGIATSFKLVGFAPVCAQLTFLMVGYFLGQYRIRTIALAIIFIFLGFFLSWLPWILYFLWKGGLIELLNISFVYPFFYGAANQNELMAIPYYLGRRLSRVGGLVFVVVVGIVLFMTCIYRFLKTSPSERNVQEARQGICGWAGLATLWLGFDLLGALAGGRFYPHYFLAMSASLCVVTGLSYWYLFEYGKSRWGNNVSIRVSVICFILGSVFMFQFADVLKLARSVRSPSAAYPLVHYLNERQKEGDTLFIWDYRPAIYFKTGLRSPHKLLSALNLKDSPYMLRLFAEDLLNRLEMQTPTYIVDAEKRRPMASSLNATYEHFRRLVDKYYELVRVEDDLRLYKVKSKP